MRIITGKHKGRRLPDFSKFRDLRPTTDKNRETLFNILNSAAFLKDLNFDLRKCDLLDVFAGSGAISFEALSRGVKSATLIDKQAKHLELAKENARVLNEAENCQFIVFDLSKPLFNSNKQYDLIYLDPPYNKNLIESTIQNLIAHNFIKKSALIISESSCEEEINLAQLPDLQLLEARKCGGTIFNFFQY